MITVLFSRTVADIMLSTFYLLSSDELSLLAESVSRSNTVGQMGGSISDGYATVTAPRGAVDNDVKLSVTDRSPPLPVPLKSHPEVSVAGVSTSVRTYLWHV